MDSSNKCLAVRTIGIPLCPGFHKNVLQNEPIEFCKRFAKRIAEINFLDSTTFLNFRVPDFTTSSKIACQTFCKTNCRNKLPGFHDFSQFSCPGFHNKQQNSLPMHCDVVGGRLVNKSSNSISQKNGLFR